MGPDLCHDRWPGGIRDHETQGHRVPELRDRGGRARSCPLRRSFPSPARPHGHESSRRTRPPARPVPPTLAEILPPPAAASGAGWRDPHRNGGGASDGCFRPIASLLPRRRPFSRLFPGNDASEEVAPEETFRRISVRIRNSNGHLVRARARLRPLTGHGTRVPQERCLLRIELRRPAGEAVELRAARRRSRVRPGSCRSGSGRIPDGRPRTPRFPDEGPGPGAAPTPRATNKAGAAGARSHAPASGCATGTRVGGVVSGSSNRAG